MWSWRCYLTFCVFKDTKDKPTSISESYLKEKLTYKVPNSKLDHGNYSINGNFHYSGWITAVPVISYVPGSEVQNRKGIQTSFLVVMSGKCQVNIPHSSQMPGSLTLTRLESRGGFCRFQYKNGKAAESVQNEKLNQLTLLPVRGKAVEPLASSLLCRGLRLDFLSERLKVYQEHHLPKHRHIQGKTGRKRHIKSWWSFRHSHPAFC